MPESRLLIFSNSVDVGSWEFPGESQVLFGKNEFSWRGVKENGSAGFPDNSEGEDGVVAEFKVVEEGAVPTRSGADLEWNFPSWCPVTYL